MYNGVEEKNFKHERCYNVCFGFAEFTLFSNRKKSLKNLQPIGGAVVIRNNYQ